MWCPLNSLSFSIPKDILCSDIRGQPLCDSHRNSRRSCAAINSRACSVLHYDRLVRHQSSRCSALTGPPTLRADTLHSTYICTNIRSCVPIQYTQYHITYIVTCIWKILFRHHLFFLL